MTVLYSRIFLGGIHVLGDLFLAAKKHAVLEIFNPLLPVAP